MNKTFTKQINDGLDAFVANGQPSQIQQPEFIANEYSNIKKIKKQDGLIERVDISTKVFITEDNRQLLRD